jgi:hypothetical protein
MLRRFLASALLISSVGTVALAGPGAQATPQVSSTTCDANLMLGFNPGLGLGEQPQQIKILGSISNCVGGGVTSATIIKGVGSGTLSCTSGTASATISLKWNTNQKSKTTVTVDTQGVIAGTVTQGKFAGEDVSADLTVNPTQGNCFPVRITRASATGPVSL